MSEKEFIESIDCRFPYFSEKKWKDIVMQSFNVNNNAVFAVLHEMCRPPR